MPIARFGQFELDLDTGELLSQDHKLPLQTKPFQLLAALVGSPGKLLTREELREKIWPAGTYVDFERSLNIAVAKLRRTLSDSADKPVYVETLPKRGYRFIAPIEVVGQRRLPLLRSGGGAPQPRIRIAILPFETHCDMEDQAHFSEDLMEEIFKRLGKLSPRQVGILPLTTNLRYPDETKSVRQMGRDLNVDHVLAGSVRIAAGQVQIIAQLTPVAEQRVSWAERYSYRAGDLLKVQVEAASKITRSLGSELIPFPSDSVEQPAAGKDAYLEYLKGQHCHSRFTSIGFRRSIQHFERAIYLDPSYAPAYSGLACSKAGLGSVVFSGGRPKDFYPQAKAAALQALALDKKASNGHTALGLVKFYL